MFFVAYGDNLALGVSWRSISLLIKTKLNFSFPTWFLHMLRDRIVWFFIMNLQRSMCLCLCCWSHKNIRLAKLSKLAKIVWNASKLSWKTVGARHVDECITSCSSKINGCSCTFWKAEISYFIFDVHCWSWFNLDHVGKCLQTLLLHDVKTVDKIF